jgi:hypothetical protein
MCRFAKNAVVALTANNAVIALTAKNETGNFFFLSTPDGEIDFGLGD